MSRPASSPAARLVFLDGLRGIASLLVAWFHFYAMTPLHVPLGRLFPAPLAWLCAHGAIGVDIFFVLSGFVIAYSVREARITRGFIGRFALRRSLRLDPPYWVTLALAIAVGAVGARLVGQAPRLPAPTVVLAHLVYLQTVLGYENIVSVFWTLGYEVQFYLVLIALLGLVQRAGRSARPWVRRAAPPLLFVPLAITSLLLVATKTLTWGWFIDWWYAFFLGACTWWTLEGRLRARWWALAALGTALAAWRAGDIAPWTVLGTACVILAVGRAGRLRAWLGWAPIQWLGRVSYSLYLVHFVGTAVAKLGARRTGDAELPALGWFLLANAVSLALALLLHRLVEAPSLRLARQPDPIAALRGWHAARNARGTTKPVSGFAE